jgi:hypothetical protein
VVASSVYVALIMGLDIGTSLGSILNICKRGWRCCGDAANARPSNEAPAGP